MKQKLFTRRFTICASDAGRNLRNLLPFNQTSVIPKGSSLEVRANLDAGDTETHCRHTLEELGKRGGKH
ncbi:MAG: hypothetical protein O2960_00740 [Verrucomicrobia bacterium]|nr:hypothetical protein [Verrucomicrobiota bacterium]